MQKEREPSGEMQVKLDDLTFEELQNYLDSLQRLSDEGKDMCSIIQSTEKVLQLRIESNINSDSSSG